MDYRQDPVDSGPTISRKLSLHNAQPMSSMSEHGIGRETQKIDNRNLIREFYAISCYTNKSLRQQ